MIAKKQTPPTVLGIIFDGGQAHISLVRRAGDSFEVQKSFSTALAESPIHGNAQTVGQEIRQALQQHGIKERRCVVGLPLKWVLSLQTKLPAIPENDVNEFLALEAERNFAYDPESLFVSTGTSVLPAGERYATIVGVQRSFVEKIQSALHAARLKPLSFTLGVAAVQQVFVDLPSPVLILVCNQDALEVAISSGGGLVATRSLDIAANGERAETGPSRADAIGRELRVTLGQLPSEIRNGLVTARLFGPKELAAPLRTELAPKLRAMGLEFEPGNDRPSSGEASPSAVAAAGAFLVGKRPSFEFLPPKISPWKQFAGKTSSRKLGWAAGIAAGVLLLFLAAFLFQGWRLARLESRWSVMAPRVTELEAMQQQIKKFRPWFDSSFRSLTILRKMTESFPVDGVVTAKTLEIRNQQVTCSGTAKDNQALFNMLDQLRGTKEVADVKMDQIRGKTPLQFSFNFRWVEGGTGEH